MFNFSYLQEVYLFFFKKQIWSDLHTRHSGFEVLHGNRVAWQEQ